MTKDERVARQPSVLSRSKSSLFGITARDLLSINEDGQTKENAAKLAELGGVEELCEALHTSAADGIPMKYTEQRAAEFGHNVSLFITTCLSSLKRRLSNKIAYMNLRALPLLPNLCVHTSSTCQCQTRRPGSACSWPPSRTPH
jgi:hypothetical protein